MNRHQKLDSILKYMSKNIGEIPKRPDSIVKNAKLNFEQTESYLLVNMLLDEGYLYEHYSKGNPTGTYGIKYKGIVFLDNGGYELQHKIYKRKQCAEKISDYVNFLVKPLGILTMILAGTFSLIKILEFIGIIHK
jgi:predicted transcriptional regulator